MSALSQDEFQKRKDLLADQIRVAGDDYQRAAYRLTLGEASADDVSKAKAAVEALQGQVEALDLAWRQQQVESADAARRQGIERRQDAIDEIERHLKARVAAARKMEKVALQLAEAAREFTAAGEAIVQAVRPHVDSRIISQDEFALLQTDARDIRHLNLVAGLMCREGLDFSVTNPGAARFELDRHGGVVGLVEKINRSLRNRARAIEPEVVG